MKRRIGWTLILLAALLCAGCSLQQSPAAQVTLPPLDDKAPTNSGMLDTQPAFQGATESQPDTQPVQMETGRQSLAAGKLSDGTEFILYTDGELLLKGQFLTACLSNQPILSDKLEKITSLTFDSGMTGAGTLSCADLPKMQLIRLPKERFSIENSAFSRCNALKIIEWGGTDKIGDNAFSDCSSLQGITLPSTVAEMGNGVFNNCNSLRTVSFDGSVPKGVLKNNTVITDVRIGDAVATIGEGAFSGCTALNSIAFGNGIQSIEKNAFTGCTALVNITLPPSLRMIGDYAFTNCTALLQVKMNESLQTVGDYAFSNCSGLKSVSILGSELVLGKDVFSGCGAITSLSINLQTIPERAFQGLTALNAVTFGSGVRQIGAYAFDGCNAISRLEFPQNLNTIGSYAFRNCSAVSGTIVIGTEIADLGTHAFEGCTQITNLHLQIREIPEYAFAAMTGLIGVEFDPSVQVIGKHAFDGCTKISEMYLPEEGITEIRDYAFANCTSLMRIILPTSLKKLGQRLFLGCEKLTLVAYRGTEYTFKQVDRGKNVYIWREGIPGGVGALKWNYKDDRWNNEKAP